MVYQPAHYSPEVLIKCGQTTRKLVTSAGASGDHYDWQVGDLSSRGSWIALALRAHRESQIFSGGLQDPRGSSGSLAMRIFLDPGWGLIHLLALEPSPGKN